MTSASSDKGADRETGTFSPVVVTPTYNNVDTLIDVLRRIEAIGLPIIVVNDGSTDGTAEALASWRAEPRDVSVTVVSSSPDGRNRGKAVALKVGFREAMRLDYTHAVTMDTDGQLAPEQIPELLDIASRAPESFVIGTRRNNTDPAPKSNRFAWWLCTLGIWLETGLRIPDSQCGLRVYPLDILGHIRCNSRRFGFESEIIVRAAWAGCDIVEIPIECRYMPEETRVSHFRPWIDGPASFLMHAWLTIRHLIPWPHARLRGATNEASIRLGPAPARRSLLDWINPAALWREVTQDHVQQLIVAASFGIGTYMASVPLGGFQVLLGIYAARRLHIHLLPVLVGLLLVLPPAGPFLAKAAIAIGHMAFHLSRPDFAVLDPAVAGHWTTLAKVPIAWLFGSTTVGFITNWVTIGTLVPLFRLIPVRRGSGLALDAPANRRGK